MNPSCDAPGCHARAENPSSDGKDYCDKHVGRYSTQPDAAEAPVGPKKLIYVAGPFTAPTPDVVRDNIRRAAALGHEVRKLGAGALVPHLIGAPYVLSACTASLPDDFGYRWWIAETLLHMKRCDGVIMTPDWETSNGARGERDDARRRGQPVFLTLAQLRDWLGVQR
jgi:hypothetical protein